MVQADRVGHIEWVYSSMHASSAVMKRPAGCHHNTQKQEAPPPLSTQKRHKAGLSESYEP